MIKLLLTGGLGNQMFEYAAAISLAKKLNKKLKIDLYALNKNTKGTKRDFELTVFGVEANKTSSLKSKMLVKCYPFFEKNRNFFQKYLKFFRDGSAIVYDNRFENLKENVTLYGHFQNPKYFCEHSDTIREAFGFKNKLSDKNLEILSQIKNKNSISIHIRRGDYLTNSYAKNNFAVCSQEYYNKAISMIREKVDNAHFFVFSEDFEWVQEKLNFESNSVQYIDWNKGDRSYIDMQLMSHCKHNIIANSSFSWWAAWLNEFPEKSVIAPNQWFTQEKRNEDLTNFYLSDWIII